MTTIRKAQVISPFGVGAIVDLEGQSYIGVGIDFWPMDSHERISDCELERKIGRPIRSPKPGMKGIPYYRFPRWLFCPKCREMKRFTESMEESLQQSAKPPTCSSCKIQLNAMGFVMACEAGHISDVDWHFWAHSSGRKNCDTRSAKLKFITTGAAGGDWSSMFIECSSCGEKRNFDGLTTRAFPRRCTGSQPWQKPYHGPSSCSKEPRVFRRGNSNLYYAHTLSAIDIQTHEADQDIEIEETLLASIPNLESYQKILHAIRDEKMVLKMAQNDWEPIAKHHGWDPEKVELIVLKMLRQPHSFPSTETSPGPDATQQGIFSEEWKVLSRPSPIRHRNLIVDPIFTNEALWPTHLIDLLPQISLLRTLREVRALVGFSRITPEASEGLIRPDVNPSGTMPSWLPGTEFRGEGILLKFNMNRIVEWEATIQSCLSSRLTHLAQACQAFGWNPTTHASPRFIALHTLAHMLMRRLCFESGYSSSSLRERIYSSQDMAGILIYTADGDSEGSLGGLVRLGHPDRLLGTISAALSDASWCSSDPVCRESIGVGIEGMNAAACHACSLVSETSCTCNNLLLDRRLLVGDRNIDGIEGLAFNILQLFQQEH